MLKIYNDDDPEVRSCKYDVFGYKPGERERIAKAKIRQQSLEGAPMAKTAKKTNPGKRGKKERPQASDTVVQTVEAAPDPKIDLWPVVLPSPEHAVQVLKGLSELNDLALEAHGRYETLKAKTKAAKQAWESLAEDVQTTLRQATHPSELPLLTVAEREQEVSQMVAGTPQDDLSGPIVVGPEEQASNMSETSQVASQPVQEAF